MVWQGSAMGKCEAGSDSVALARSLKFWRLIFYSVRCAGGFQRQRPSRRRAPEKRKNSGSEKLSELLKQPEWWESEEVVRKEEKLERLKTVARKLQEPGEESKSTVEEAAAEVRRLAKDDPDSRTTLALLGVIPPLVGLLDEGQDPAFNSRIAALYALLNLAIANDANKAAIVKSGAVHKMLKLVRSPNGAPNRAIAEAVVANFLGLSALDANKPISGSSGAVPFLVETLENLDETGCSLAKKDSLRALYNLSILPSNVCTLLETDLIPHLVSNLGDMDVSEVILSTLINLVSQADGRKQIGNVPDVFPILVDVLNWNDSPGCQEKASYILMVMAHKSYADRQAMIEAGVVSSLLELTLLGSVLAQKRASKLLECLRVDKGKQVSGDWGGGGAQSAPLCATSSSLKSGDGETADLDEDDEMMSEEKKAVKNLVQQSLSNNMKRMVKRANLPHDFVPSDHFKSLTLSSTSKSLPF